MSDSAPGSTPTCDELPGVVEIEGRDECVKLNDPRRDDSSSEGEYARVPSVSVCGVTGGRGTLLALLVLARLTICTELLGE